MSTLLESRIALLGAPARRHLLQQGLRGIERETLRVDAFGKLAHSPHPRAWGSALTHPHLTTDYAETLVEFITPARHDIGQAIDDLCGAHRFAYSHLHDEMLWMHSMPAQLPPEDEIAIAWYGVSNPGMLKHVYRRGLALRYGKAMQCIAGVHYNFSLSEDVWALLQTEEAQLLPNLANLSRQDYQSESYMALIRNFRRYSWLLMYLFGASPALSTCFLQGREHQLERLSDDTLFLPYATSLRMSDLGYQNDAQTDLQPRENSLECYVHTLSEAVNKPWPPYAELGLRHGQDWVQISTNVLQIENEYYSTIRPKRITKPGERPIQALCRRGVQYIEVRCLDVDPFEPAGIARDTARFMDVFLHWCALAESAPIFAEGKQENAHNFATVVKEGRRPGLQLQRNGHAISLHDWGRELIAEMQEVADLLDLVRGDDTHRRTLALQAGKLEHPELTPSARVLEAIRSYDNSFHEFALQQSVLHANWFRNHPPAPELAREYEHMAEQSLAEQRAMEAADQISFDEYIEAYRHSKLCQECDPAPAHMSVECA
ncbi:glutamate--cysteine ligase [Massilia sp. W12]|uniref:glutamate--cysteine ligase n=1 Tax=Massilia sp. W12 TaxID=3126507 RepID=UPI0030D3C3D5